MANASKKPVLWCATGGGFALRRDAGGRYKLDLHRVPVDEVETRVRVIGTLIAEGHLDVDGVAPA